MNAPATDEGLARLREEIRRAGGQALAVRVRWTFSGIAIIVLPSLAALAFAFVPGLLPFASAACLSVPFGLMIGLVGLIAAAERRSESRKAFARRLARVSPAERGVILLPLRSDSVEDTHALAEELIRELGVSTEVSPAAAPGGRGDDIAGP